MKFDDTREDLLGPLNSQDLPPSISVFETQGGYFSFRLPHHLLLKISDPKQTGCRQEDMHHS